MEDERTVERRAARERLTVMVEARRISGLGVPVEARRRWAFALEEGGELLRGGEAEPEKGAEIKFLSSDFSLLIPLRRSNERRVVLRGERTSSSTLRVRARGAGGGEGGGGDSERSCSSIARSSASQSMLTAFMAAMPCVSSPSDRGPRSSISVSIATPT